MYRHRKNGESGHLCSLAILNFQLSKCFRGWYARGGHILPPSSPSCPLLTVIDHSPPFCWTGMNQHRILGSHYQLIWASILLENKLPCSQHSKVIQEKTESYSVQFSGSIVSDILRSHGLQHARPPCPLPTPGVYSNSCPMSQWCHPTISSSVIPFSSRLNLSQHQGLCKWVSSLHQVVKVLEFQLQHQSFQWIFRTDFL